MSMYTLHYPTKQILSSEVKSTKDVHYIFDMGSVMMAYVKEGGVSFLNDFENTGLRIDEKEITDFNDKVDEENSINIGNEVLVAGYGKLLFTVDRVDDDDLLISTVIRNRKYKLNVHQSEVYHNLNEDIFKYEDTTKLVLNDVVVVIGDQWIEDMTSSYDVLIFVLRVKLRHSKRAIIWCGKNNEYVRAIFNILGLVMVDYVIDSDVYVAKTPNIFKHNYTRVGIDKNGSLTSHKEDLGSYMRYMARLHNESCIPYIDKFLSSRTIDSINHYNRQTYAGFIKESVFEENTIMPKEYDGEISIEIDDVEVSSIFTKHGWVWFSENYDHFIRIIRG